MDFIFTPSSRKHGISNEDALYVIRNPTYTGGLSGGNHVSYALIFIGFQHPQTEREIEVLMRVYRRSQRWPEVFHVMWLSSKYDKFRRDNPNGLVDRESLGN
jgi:hypothetical protein